MWKKARTRGALLTTWLILILIILILSALSYLLLGTFIKQAFPENFKWLYWFSIVIIIVEFISIIAIFKWKKWGVYTYCVSYSVEFLISIISFGIIVSIFGLIGLIILILLVRPKWSLFD